MELNTEQQQAVDAVGNVIIIAPPGSGKTKTLISKAQTLLQSPENRICMVTFTRNAAMEMTERLNDPDNRTQVSTFHSIAFKQLVSIGIDVIPMSGFEQREIIKKAN